MDAAFTASGRSLRDIYRMTGFSMPESDRFSLTGKIVRRHERTTFSELKSHVGESDIDGSVMLVNENGVRRFETDLHAGVFRLRDFGLHGAQASPPSAVTKKSIFPDTPIPLGDREEPRGQSAAAGGSHRRRAVSTSISLSQKP